MLRGDLEAYIRANGRVFKELSLDWFNGLSADQRSRYISSRQRA